MGDTYADQLIQLLEQHNLSQADLARGTGLFPKQINGYVLEKHTPQAKTKKIIEDFFENLASVKKKDDDGRINVEFDQSTLWIGAPGTGKSRYIGRSVKYYLAAPEETALIIDEDGELDWALEALGDRVKRLDLRRDGKRDLEFNLLAQGAWINDTIPRVYPWEKARNIVMAKAMTMDLAHIKTAILKCADETNLSEAMKSNICQDLIWGITHEYSSFAISSKKVEINPGDIIYVTLTPYSIWLSQAVIQYLAREYKKQVPHVTIYIDAPSYLPAYFEAFTADDAEKGIVKISGDIYATCQTVTVLRRYKTDEKRTFPYAYYADAFHNIQVLKCTEYETAEYIVKRAGEQKVHEKGADGSYHFTTRKRLTESSVLRMKAEEKLIIDKHGTQFVKNKPQSEFREQDLSDTNRSDFESASRT